MALRIRHFTTVAMLFGALAVAGCAARSASIADLKYNPGRYYNRTVSVEGVVSSAWGVPLVPVQVYKLQDGTGEVTVADVHPWRRNVDFLDCTETPIKPLIERLGFIEDKSRWGYKFRFGVFRIDDHDLEVIRSVMTG